MIGMCLVGGELHPVSDSLCTRCLPGHPLTCICGGLIHASGWGQVSTLCDQCGEAGHPVEPMILDGKPHSPGRQDCPACPGGRSAPCVCGGLIHSDGGDGGEVIDERSRRCDRCGDRHEEIDI